MTDYYNKGAWEQRQKKNRREFNRALLLAVGVLSASLLVRYCTSDERYVPAKKNYEVDYVW